MTRALVRTIVIPAVVLLPLVGCEAKKSSNPLSPSIAGPIEGVEITTPRLLEPSQGTRLKASQQPVRLLIENSSTNGVRPVAYVFEVATDREFANKAFSRSGVAPGGDGRTSVTVDALETGRKYYWRVKADDGANSSPHALSEFELLPRPHMDPPPAHAPANNAQLANRKPELVVGRSNRNEAIGNVVYYFQIALDVTFGSIVSDGSRSEAGGTTMYMPAADLTGNTTYYWRARASDGEFTSDWTPINAFRTAAAPAPGPGPAPGPAPVPGGPCNSSNPEAIVQCERAKYPGFMSHSQMYDFVVAVVQSLNRNGIGGGPFGILRKTGGTNCNGYSCDVICAGQGGGQRQYDVLSDIDGAQSAKFDGPLPTIRVDVCEIR